MQVIYGLKNILKLLSGALVTLIIPTHFQSQLSKHLKTQRYSTKTNSSTGYCLSSTNSTERLPNATVQQSRLLSPCAGSILATGMSFCLGSHTFTVPAKIVIALFG